MHDDTLRPDPIRAARDEVARPGVRPADTKAPGERPGDAIDRYKLLQEIGEGGMGTVWMAEQKQPVVRKVALKIIKLGMDTREVVTRFEAERQALALMDHASIAKVLDGGATSTGRPFFVMELVKGIPITQYCDEAKLSLRERLALFAKVCEAIQHAHTKGIIHRDVKPSNVLVTLHDGTPLPKVIDFGIAKATSAELTKKTMFTQFAQMIGTPEYMAPEQAAMSALDIDTRADIYSLGVLLYELLTGTKPFEITKVLEKGYQELLRTIREDDPAKPSTRVSTLGDKGTTIEAQRHVHAGKLSSNLRGDLDWIVMKALEKDRTRRYETANGFAMDVQRYLDGHAVLAAPPSASYRLRKFIGRRKKTVAAAAVITFLLVAGSIGTGIGWYQTTQANLALGVAITQKEQQRQLAGAAQTRAETAETAAKAEAERARLAQAEATRRAAELEQVSEFQAKQLSDLDVELMGVRLRQSLIDAAPADRRTALTSSLTDVNFTSLSLKTLDENLFGRTIQTIDTQFADQPMVRARLLYNLGDTLRTLGLFDVATDCLRRSLEFRQKELGDDHLDTLLSLDKLATLFGQRGQPDRAESLFRRELAIRTRVQGASAEDTLMVMTSLGATLPDEKAAEATSLFREALAGLRQLPAGSSYTVASALHGLGLLIWDRGQPVEGEAFVRQALAGLRRSVGDRALDTLTVLCNLGTHLAMDGRLAEAEPLLHEALDACHEAFGNEHAQTLCAIANMGYLRRRQQRLADAEACYREAFTGRLRGLGAEHRETLMVQQDLVQALMAQQEWPEAEPMIRDNLAVARRVFGDDDPLTLLALTDLSALLQDENKGDEAEPFAREAMVRSRRVRGDTNVETLTTISNLGMTLTALGKPAEAEPLLREALAGRQSTLGAEHPDTLESMFHLAKALHRQGKFAAAEATCRETLEVMRRVLGMAHPHTVAATELMSACLWGQRKLAEAEPFAREALAGYRRLGGETHRATQRVTGNLGVLLAELGNGIDAEPLLRDALASRRRATDRLDEDTLNLISHLAVALSDQGKFTDVEHCLEEAVDGARLVDDPAVRMIAFGSLGNLLVSQNRFAEAEPLVSEQIAAARRIENPDPIAHSQGLANLGMCYLENGKATAAEGPLAEALAIRTQVLPTEDWRLRSVRNYLGAAIGRQGRFAEAESMLVESAEWMLTSPAMPSAATLGADRAGAAANRVAQFYEAWHAAEPGKDHAAKAAAWRARLAAHQGHVGK